MAARLVLLSLLVPLCLGSGTLLPISTQGTPEITTQLGHGGASVSGSPLQHTENIPKPVFEDLSIVSRTKERTHDEAVRSDLNTRLNIAAKKLAHGSSVHELKASQSRSSDVFAMAPPTLPNPQASGPDPPAHILATNSQHQPVIVATQPQLQAPQQIAVQGEAPVAAPIRSLEQLPHTVPLALTPSLDHQLTPDAERPTLDFVDVPPTATSPFMFHQADAAAERTDYIGSDPSSSSDSNSSGSSSSSSSSSDSSGSGGGKPSNSDGSQQCSQSSSDSSNSFSSSSDSSNSSSSSSDSSDSLNSSDSSESSKSSADDPSSTPANSFYSSSSSSAAAESFQTMS